MDINHDLYPDLVDDWPRCRDRLEVAALKRSLAEKVAAMAQRAAEHAWRDDQKAAKIAQLEAQIQEKAQVCLLRRSLQSTSMTSASYPLARRCIAQNDAFF